MASKQAQEAYKKIRRQQRKEKKKKYQPKIIREILQTTLLVFFINKIAEVPPFADWSWWWILSPFLIPVGLVAIVFAIILAWVVIDRTVYNIRNRTNDTKGKEQEATTTT